MVKINDLTNKRTYEVDNGTSLLDISDQQNKDAKPRIAVALYNNKLVGLQTKVTEDGKVEWFSQATIEGNNSIQRTVVFLMIRAVSDLYPEGKVYVKHALRKALYCELDVGHTITVRDVNSIKRRMQELIQQNEPIHQIAVSTDTAMDMCRNRNLDREAELLRHVNIDYVMTYQCGPVFDYYMGPLLPDMGYITCFNVRSYAPGVILEYPKVENPYELPEYMEIPKLARVFLESEEWGRIVRCQYVSDLNRYIEEGTIQDIVDMAEALQEKRMAHLADYVHKQRPKIKVVLIAGPSSAGKTTFCKRLVTQLRVVGLRPVQISLDDYFLNREDTPRNEDGSYDFESLRAIDVNLFNQQVDDLHQGKEVHLARFDFISGHRHFDEKPTVLEYDQPIVVEGLHALNDTLTYTLPRYEKVKISLGVLTQIRINDHNRISTADTRIIRRMVRDHQFRNRGPDATLQIWSDVRLGEETNIYPYQEDADAIFNTALPYELAALKPYAVPLLSSITEDSPYYHEAHRLLMFLMPFQPIDSSIVPPNSIIREFIGK